MGALRASESREQHQPARLEFWFVAAVHRSVYWTHRNYEMLIDANADINLPNRDLVTPLHIAVFMGRTQEAASLLRAGADVNARDGSKRTPKELLKTDFGTTNFIASSLGVPVSEEALLAGRKEIAKLLNETEYLGSEASAGQALNLAGLKGLLFQLPVFMHLWFLWFLCWLVAAFSIYVPIAKVFKIKSLPRWLVCSPISLLLLIPLTVLPQSFMAAGSFGPDSSIGLIPIPSVLIYYAVFYFFGAVYWDMDDTSGRLAWLMTFGSIGLSRRLLSRESKTLRYISDSSYWLYLIHLPLVILAQWLIRDLQIPAFLKFATITIVISALLLLSYEFGVRYTVIGKLLNGPRTRRTQTTVFKHGRQR